MIRQFYLVDEVGMTYFFDYRNKTLISDISNLGFSKTNTYLKYDDEYSLVKTENPQETLQFKVVFLEGYKGYSDFLNFYRKAIKLRKELSAVKYGNYKEYNKCSSKVYTYLREDDKQKILVVCSYYSKETSFNVPKDFDITSSKLVLTNYNNNSLVLKPYECRVYVLEK